MNGHYFQECMRNTSTNYKSITYPKDLRRERIQVAKKGRIEDVVGMPTFFLITRQQSKNHNHCSIWQGAELASCSITTDNDFRNAAPHDYRYLALFSTVCNALRTRHENNIKSRKLRVSTNPPEIDTNSHSQVTIGLLRNDLMQ